MKLETRLFIMYNRIYKHRFVCLDTKSESVNCSHIANARIEDSP